MKFTFFAYLPSILLLALAMLQPETKHPDHNTVLVGGFGAILFFFATFAVGIYWLVRLVRYAWGERPAPVESAPSDGRIFGRLS